MRFTSGPPWHVSLSLEGIGEDLLCRIHGGDAHVGAVALAQWHEGRPRVDGQVVGSHKEDRIALHAADTLCRVARGTVVCIAGIHYDGITREEIRAICDAASDLAGRAARELKACPAPPRP